MSRYEDALANLDTGSRKAVEDAFKDWTKDLNLKQAFENVIGECALSHGKFRSLLASFASQLIGGERSEQAWINACRSHKLNGSQVASANCPPVLGRVKTLIDHAKAVAKASAGGLTPSEAERQLIKHSNSTNPIGFEVFLRDAALGNYVVWATFNPDDPTASPFGRLPNTRDGICTALGLGGGPMREVLIVLAWGHIESGSPSLFRPTVADAECNVYYRPFPDPSSLCGFTFPLVPNPSGLAPQPELVMSEVSSKGLRLPFRIVSA
jgi:hypothetical protein